MAFSFFTSFLYFNVILIRFTCIIACSCTPFILIAYDAPLWEHTAIYKCILLEVGTEQFPALGYYK